MEGTTAISTEQSTADSTTTSTYIVAGRQRGRPTGPRWLADRTISFISLLKTICKMKDPIKDKNAYLLAKIVEQIYFAKHSRLLLPLWVRESILLYSMTSSKILASFEDATTPSGSYWILICTLDEGASKSIPFPEGTARVAFDNNQIIGKTYSIRADNKVPASIMTTTLYAQISDKELQQKKGNSPPPTGCGKNLMIKIKTC